MDGEFRIATPVRLTDLDLNGHVNHGAYLVYAEAARVHHLGSLGAAAPRLVAEGLAVIVLRLEIDYMGEVGMDDAVEATSRYIFEPGRTAFRNHGQVLRGGTPAADLAVTLGLLDLEQRKLRKAPADVLTGLIESAHGTQEENHV